MIVTNQITIPAGATPTLIVPLVSRDGSEVTQMSEVEAYIGDASVTTTTGSLLRGIIGESKSIPGSDAVYAVVAGSVPGKVSVLERR